MDQPGQPEHPEQPEQHPPSYILGIPSLTSKHPQLPVVLANLRMDKEIRAGDPIDPKNLKNARAVAGALREVAESGEVPEATAEVVESARSRLIAVEHAHSALQFTPQDTNQQLRDIINRLIQIQNTQNDTTNRLTEVQNAQNDATNRLTEIQNTLDDIIEAQKTASAELANLRILNQN